MTALHPPRLARTRDAAALTAAGIVVGLLGPFGSYLNGSPVVLLAYWVGCLWLGAGLLAGIHGRVAPWTERRGAAAPVAAVLSVLLSALPAALLSRLVATGLWPGPIARVPLLEWCGQTLLVLSGLALGRSVLARQPGAAPPTPPPAPGDLVGRLPPQLGRDVTALQMEDHYVRVHTRAGSALVLMPMRQAVQSVEHIPGLAVHRSWWVARVAVTGCRRDGRNLRLVLAGGLVVPVARARLAAARKAGLVGDEA